MRLHFPSYCYLREGKGAKLQGVERSVCAWSTQRRIRGVLRERSLVKPYCEPVRDHGAQWATQVKALVLYVHKVSVPVGLSIEPQFRVSSSPLESGVVLALAVLSGLVVLGRARRSAAWCGMVFYCIVASFYRATERFG